MCGRYTLQRSAAEIVKDINVEIRSNFKASTNIAPSELVPVVMLEASTAIIEDCPWGYKTDWTTGPKFLVNLKSETILEKRFASKPLKRGRCIMPISGFYEWKRINDKEKAPVLFEPKGQEILGIAGLIFQKADNTRQCVVLTTSPNKLLSQVHDRMPVLIDKSQWLDWIENEDPNAAVAKYAKPYKEGILKAWIVNSQISNARYKGELIRESEIS